MSEKSCGSNEPAKSAVSDVLAMLEELAKKSSERPDAETCIRDFFSKRGQDISDGAVRAMSDDPQRALQLFRGWSERLMTFDESKIPRHQAAPFAAKAREVAKRQAAGSVDPMMNVTAESAKAVAENCFAEKFVVFPGCELFLDEHTASQMNVELANLGGEPRNHQLNTLILFCERHSIVMPRGGFDYILNNLEEVRVNLAAFLSGFRTEKTPSHVENLPAQTRNHLGRAFRDEDEQQPKRPPGRPPSAVPLQPDRSEVTPFSAPSPLPPHSSGPILTEVEEGLAAQRKPRGLAPA